MNNELQITGRVSQHLDVQTGEGAKGPWRKGGVVIDTGDQYNPHVAIQAWNDKLDELPDVGATVTAHVNINSREYQGKWYTDVTLWKYDIEDPAQGNNEWAQDPSEATAQDFGAADSGLPF